MSTPYTHHSRQPAHNGQLMSIRYTGSSSTPYQVSELEFARVTCVSRADVPQSICSSGSARVRSEKSPHVCTTLARTEVCRVSSCLAGFGVHTGRWCLSILSTSILHFRHAERMSPAPARTPCYILRMHIQYTYIVHHSIICSL